MGRLFRCSHRCAFGALVLGGVWLLGCKATQPAYPPAWELGGQTQAYHEGPYVMAGVDGPRGHLSALIEHWPLRENGDYPPFDPETLGWQAWRAEADPESEPHTWFYAAQPRENREGNEPAPAVTQTIVIEVPDGEAWDCVLLGLQAWSQATGALSLVPSDQNVLVTKRACADLRSAMLDRELLPSAWICVTEREPGPAKLVRGPDPMAPLERESDAPSVDSPGLEAPSLRSRGHGLALILRMAFVDVGLEARPWKSLERPYDGWESARELALLGIAQARVELGTSELDVSKSDLPEMGESERQALVLWSAVQCMAAPTTTELDRYLASLKLETRLRHNQDPKLVDAWKVWLTEARHWLRALTLKIE